MRSFFYSIFVLFEVHHSIVVAQKVQCRTTAGSFTINMHKEWAPIGYERFMELVKSDFFSNQIVYRVLPGFVVQFGVAADPSVQKIWDSQRLKDDVKQDIDFTVGTVSFAGAGKDSRTCHIFISLEPQGKQLGNAFHERPFGRIENIEDQKVISNFYSGYGDLTRLQSSLATEGNVALKDFSRLDKILSCDIIETDKDYVVGPSLIYLIFEVTNSLLITFIATEYWISRRSVHKMSRLLCCVIIVNIIFSLIYNSSYFKNYSRFVYSISTPLHWIAGFVGSSGLASMLITGICAGILVGSLHRSKEKMKEIHIILLISIWIGQFFIFKFFGMNDNHIHHLELLRITLAAISFIVICFLDCKRISPRLSFSRFSKELGMSVLLVLPLFPCIAIGFSALFLFIVSIFSALGLSTGRSSVLNPIIYYGTLYGPFSAVYWQTKTKCKKIKAIGPLPE
eukprot:GSMAST32.ASY1.ANO1.300.1 assembled CDS